METAGPGVSLEEQIDQWRTYLRHRQAIHSVDVAELEDHLRVLPGHGAATTIGRERAWLDLVRREGRLPL